MNIKELLKDTLKMVCLDCGGDVIPAPYQNHKYYCVKCKSELIIDEVGFEKVEL